jgi:putative MFS transporter
LVAIGLLVRLPESPRWLLSTGRRREAMAIVGAIEREVRQAGGPLPEVEGTEDANPPGRVAVGALLRPPLRRRTVMLLAAWIFQTLGFYGFVSWVPTLLAEHGFSLATGLTFSALTTIGAVPGALLAWPISDRFRRKTPAVIVAVLVAGCGISYGLSFNAVAIVAFGFAVSFLIQTFAALLYAYTPELYPTAVRNTGSGFVYGVGRLANIIGPLLVALIYSRAGYAWVFVYIGACWLVVAAAIGIFGPRSGQASLETFEV